MTQSKIVSAGLGACAIGWLVASAVAFAGDEPGSRDHSPVGRYQGSSIVFYKGSDFEEAALLQAPHVYGALLERDAVHDRAGGEWLKVEGRIVRIRYEVPPGRSSLEVVRNYESTLKTKGFEVVFSCEDRACFQGKLQDPYLLGQQLDPDNGDSSLYFDHARYLLARLNRPEGPVHVAILAGEDKQRITAFVVVVEGRAMERDKVAFLDAGKIGQAIAQAGKSASTASTSTTTRTCFAPSRLRRSSRSQSC